jgi:hypothetical protein
MYSRRWNTLTASAVISPGMSAQAIVARGLKGCPCVMAARTFGFKMFWSEANKGSRAKPPRTKKLDPLRLGARNTEEANMVTIRTERSSAATEFLQQSHSIYARQLQGK